MWRAAPTSRIRQVRGDDPQTGRRVCQHVAVDPVMLRPPVQCDHRPVAAFRPRLGDVELHPAGLDERRRTPTMSGGALPDAPVAITGLWKHLVTGGRLPYPRPSGVSKETIDN